MYQILSCVVHLNHDPIDGEYFITALLHDGGDQVEKFHLRGPMLLHLFGNLHAKLLAVSARHFQHEGYDSGWRHGDTGEQTELPF